MGGVAPKPRSERCPGCKASVKGDKCEKCGMHIDYIEDHYPIHCTSAACLTQRQNAKLKKQVAKLTRLRERTG